MRAKTLQGDHILAGPVLVQHQAVWIETGLHRLVVRALKLNGQARTVFSTSKAPGTAKGARWPYLISSLAAGDGRVAFVDQVMSCNSSPPGDRRCIASSHPPIPPDSISLFAGRLGDIRPIQTMVHPRCPWSGPGALAVANAGLVVDERRGCYPSVSHLVLMSFSGRPLRELMKGPQVGPPLAAAGDWVAYMVGLQRLRIMRISTARIALRLRRPFIYGVALDPSGWFVFMTPGAVPPCSSKRGPALSVLSIAKVGSKGVRVLAAQADAGISAASIGFAIAGGRVVYGAPTGRCLHTEQVVIRSPGAAPKRLDDLHFTNGLTAEEISSQLVFDGQVVATDHGHTVELAAVSSWRSFAVRSIDQRQWAGGASVAPSILRPSPATGGQRGRDSE